MSAHLFPFNPPCTLSVNFPWKKANTFNKASHTKGVEKLVGDDWEISLSTKTLYGHCCIIGSIRMNILMLDTRNVEQTKDVRMYT